MQSPWRLGLIPAVLLCVAAGAQEDDIYKLELEDGQTALQKGRLDRAAYHFDEILLADEEEEGSDRPDPLYVTAARTGLQEIELRRGRYEPVLDAVAALSAGERAERANQLLMVRAGLALGRYEAAETRLRKLVAGDAGDWESSYRLGSLLFETGRRDAARKVWNGILDRAGPGDDVDPVQLGWAGRAAMRFAPDNGRLQQAADWLVESMGKGGNDPRARTAYGTLMFEVYGEAAGFPSGEKALKQVLENNGDVEEALLALFRLRRSNQNLDYRKTDGYLRRVLALNPSSVPAMVEQAHIEIDDRQFGTAAARLDKALDIHPKHKPALAHRVSAALLQNDPEGAAQFRRTLFEVDPTYADAERIHGDHLVRLYRFGDAIPIYEKALAVDPESVPALHGLARALIYAGRGAEAAERLRAAKALQPGYVHPWRNNALAAQNLLTEEYVTVERGGVALRLHRDDAEILESYLLPLYLEAREVLGEKYGHKPPATVQVEVFRTWDDFSVRTTGFRGFTALGACFGPLITMVSPRDGDLRRQDFMWAATVWHEYAHVLTLALSDHRVPRWLTEGCSVHEERAKNPLWERGMDRELFDAWHNDDVPPVRLLNRLFRGGRILFGYYQGGLIVDLVAEDYGFEKVAEMVAAYGRDLSTTQVFETVLGMAPSEFDKKLAARVQQRVNRLKMIPAVGPRLQRKLVERLATDASDIEARILLGWGYLQTGNPVDAGRELAAALRAEPENGQALLLHAALQMRRGEQGEAEALYARGFAAGTEDFDSRIAFGKLLEARGKLEEAIAQYQRAKLCWPGCTDQQNAPELHLARLYARAGDEERELMELKSFVRRTARAFAPRLRLAANEGANGRYDEAAHLLEEAVQIDPFMRELHERLAECYVELERYGAAARELEVAAAVRPSVDRKFLGESAPADDSDEEKSARLALLERAAGMWRKSGNEEQAARALEKAGRVKEP